MSSCKTCLIVIKKNQLKISCSDCNGEFHAKCVNMTQADINYMAEQNTHWRCEPCSSVRRKSLRLDYSLQEGSVTLEDIMEMLKGIQEEQKTTVKDFNKSFEALHDKIEERTTALEVKMRLIEEYINETDKLRVENITLKKQVTTLENRIEDLENYSRRNCIEIQGIPEEKGENVTDVVKKVGEALGVKIADDMIDACHRVGGRTGEKRPRGIILKLVRRTDKDTIMRKRQERKRDFSTRHLGMSSDTPVYLNDSLSPSRRRLLGRARQLKIEKAYKYLWLRNGNILLRKQEGSPVLEIRCQADLDKM